MGQTLSSPATEKSTDSGGNERFLYAVSEMQGWRITMEDAHTAVLRLDEERPDSNTFFAVYDGHGGGTVSKYAGQHVHRRLKSEESYQEKSYETALKKAFLGIDEDMLADPAYTRDPSGSTAVAALVTAENQIYVANAGDSRSVISVKGEVKPLSYDHKPQNQTEKDRIVAAGGYIEYGRVNGNLALARALGDFEFKKNYSLGPEKQVITADPDVIHHEITEEDEFLILACDGIWDCLTSQQVVDIVRLKVSEGMELSEICEFLCELCLAPDTTSGAGIGCDNMTVLIVALLHGRTKEQWYEWVQDRVKSKYGYDTPETVPQIYATSRLMSFKARRQAQEERTERDRQDRISGLLGGPSTFGSFARVLGSSGGISFHPSSGIIGDNGTLMFDNDDSDEDDSGEEDMETDGADSRSFFSATFGRAPDVTKTLREQLNELHGDVDKSDAEMSEPEDDHSHGPYGASSNHVADSDLHAIEAGHSPDLQGEAPPPPKPLPNGNPAVDQFESHPTGDEPSASLKAEGLMDSSESPLKV
ncbi:hypothetical protein JAAARDRAFT_30322 [Jaapia argillacea MUCL 33604]|uniref:protein-serine/threonine phosphatase n=1 Tax=Jaapia argillacea MUCL 33604 TaxID=933084 RepID=A0A067QG00_9AGAM|nr:hypothetical protein JAAARDRAFT_30322 [Jaapia argillacea MUCL 33604]